MAELGAVHLESDLGASPGLGALAPALFAGAAALSRLGGRALAGRVSELTLMRGGAALGAAGTLLGALAPVAGLALVGIIAAGAGISICAPVLFSLAGRGADEALRGAAVSIVATIAYLGFLVGPAAVGLLAAPRPPRRASPRWPASLWRSPILAPASHPRRGLDRSAGTRRTIAEAAVRPSRSYGLIRLARWDVAARSARPGPRRPRAPDRRPFRRPRARPRFWLALWAVAIGAEFAALIPVIWPGEEPVETVQVIYRLIGGSFAACGLIAWRRRPDSRSGILMAAAGAGFFISAILSQFDPPLTQTAAIAPSRSSGRPSSWRCWGRS